MPIAAIDLLTEGRRLIAGPGAWTQGTAARDSAGVETHPQSDRAVAFCAAGAIHRAAHHCVTIFEATAAIDAAQEMLVDQMPGESPPPLLIYSVVSDYNDAPERTQAEMVALFDAAIAMEKAR